MMDGFNCLHCLVHADGSRYRDGDGACRNSGQVTLTWTAEMDVMRATARLPGLDTESEHRRAIEDGTEEISIGLRALLRSPSFVRLKPSGCGRRPCNAPGSLA
jgi:hypothetical protein